ncbi:MULTISPECIES: hypothetical protein [Streptomyces]|uniref:hypothetical protein n=1 Tax=Streptomyces TaxID=1883 RepID=UPI00099880C2|nr:hypothetical protein [Streptomyces sp. CNS654]
MPATPCRGNPAAATALAGCGRPGRTNGLPSPRGRTRIGFGERLHVPSLSIASGLLAFTAIGLIARWGEVFPRWVPYLGGRQVPRWAAVVPAAIGATVLTLVFTVLFIVTGIRGTTIRGDELPADFPGEAGGRESAWFSLRYAPLVLWGPLMVVLTVAYHQRRRGTDRPAATA